MKFKYPTLTGALAFLISKSDAGHQNRVPPVRLSTSRLSPPGYANC